jgi:hypothetical protein
MGPAEQEEGGSLRVYCQPNVPGIMVLSGCTAPHVRAKERAALSTEGRGHVPTEVRKLLVDALESHGYCAGLFVVKGVQYCACAVVGWVESVGEEFKWAVSVLASPWKLRHTSRTFVSLQVRGKQAEYGEKY